MIALGQVRLSRLVTANVGNTEAALSPMEGQAAEAPLLKCLVQLGRIHQIVLERIFKNFFFLAHLTHLNDYRRPLSWSQTSTHYLYHRRLWNLPWSLQAIRGVVTVWLCRSLASQPFLHQWCRRLRSYQCSTWEKTCSPDLSVNGVTLY